MAVPQHVMTLVTRQGRTLYDRVLREYFTEPDAHRWRCSCGGKSLRWTCRNNALYGFDLHLRFAARRLPQPVEPAIEEHW